MARARFRPRATTSEARRADTRRRSIVVTVPVPVSVARRARTVIYPYPVQRQLRRRVIRMPFYSPRERFVVKRVKVLLPRVLPALGASYVSVTDSGMAIHSLNQTVRLMDREFNRRRYQEHKSRQRKARNGQLSSVRADRLGMLGFAARAGFDARRMAEVAMVSRALGGS